MKKSGQVMLLLGLLALLCGAGCGKTAPPAEVAVAPPPTEIAQPPVAEPAAPGKTVEAAEPAKGQPSQTGELKPDKAAAASSTGGKPASPAASKPAASKPAPAANRPTGGGQQPGGQRAGGPSGDGLSIEERFKSWDKNKDGKLTAEELPSERLLEWLDTNKDGVITLEEAKKAMANRPREGGARGDRPQLTEAQRKQRLEARFKERDANNDGKLTAGEIPEEMLERLDTNKDGAVSKEEMAKARRQMGRGGAGGPGRGQGGGN